MARPFRFGLALAGFDHGHDWAEVAVRVEDLGYSTLLVPDHLGDQLGPMPALAAAAQATSTLRVGTYVLNNDLRHPAVLAKEAATVDVLSGGRFELGLGAGWKASDYTSAGLDLDPPATRLARLEESVSVIRGLWSGAPFSYAGRHYSIEGMEGRPMPVQQPAPPLLMGGSGPRLLSLAGRVADIVGIVPRAGPEGLDLGEGRSDAALNRLSHVREAAGERWPQLELNASTVVAEIHPDRGSRAEELGRHAGLSGQEVLASPHVLLGRVEEVVEDLLARRERFGLSYVVVPEPALRAFAPVVARLAGT